MARRYKLWSNIDLLVVVIYVALVISGWINIYASVYNEEHGSIFDFSQRYGKQLIWILLGFSLGFFVLLIEVNFYTFFAYSFYLISIIVLVLVFLFGTEIHGSKSWFEVGGFALQPSEFAKFTTSLALAKYLSSVNTKSLKFIHLFVAVIIILTPVILIFLQHDTGSALVYFAFILVLYREGLSGIVLFFTALASILFFLALKISSEYLVVSLYISALVALLFFNIRIRQLFRIILISAVVALLVFSVNYLFSLNIETGILLFLISGILSIVFFYFIFQLKLRRILLVLLVYSGSLIFTYSVEFLFNNFLEPHQQNRINEMLGVSSDPLGAGYNVNQSKIAIGSGGMWGKGFLNGTQTKYNFVPEQDTDFIFCTVGEEWGFIGSLVVIGLFTILLIRLVNMAERQRSSFSRIYGYAVISVLLIHMMVNIGMTIGIMPVIGIPLPFFSYGGSSLWSFTILLFIFIRLDASRLDKLL